MKRIVKLSAAGCALAAALFTAASFGSGDNANAGTARPAAVSADVRELAVTATPPPVNRTLPDPAPYIHVANSGPANGGPASGAQQALDTQFPLDSTDYVIYGTYVLSFGKYLADLFPEVRAEYNEVAAFGKCGISNGVFDARFYVNKKLTSGAAAAVVIVTGESTSELAEIAAKCVVHEAFSGGGPTDSNLSPQVIFFKYYTRTGNYYVMLAATNRPTYVSFYNWFGSRYPLYAA